MMKVFLRYISFLCFCFACNSFTYAVEVKDLYQTNVLVPSQSQHHREVAMKQAMANVLIKISGQKTIQQNDIFRQAITQPDNYYLQYRYEYEQKDIFLVVDFNQDKINQLFKSSQQAIWGRLRPQVLLWFVDEQYLTRKIISSSSNSAYAKKIKQLAKQRGLPLILPLMDLDDISNVSTADLWGRFVAPIRLASERYYPEKIVIIRMSDHSLLENKVNSQNCGLLCPEQTIVIDWSIIEDRQTFSDSYKGTDVDELLSQVVDDITEHIYQQYALSTDSNDDVYIDINNVNDLTNYVNAFDFLQNLSSVQSVTLTQVSGQHRRFKLQVLGSKATLMASLKLSKQLILQKDPLAETQADDIPVFYWQN